MSEARRLRRWMNKKIKKLGSDPATVERIEDRCPFCGEIFSLVICKKGTVGVSENPCCIITCNRLRRERGLPGLLEFECPGCAEAKSGCKNDWI
jgi:phage FluMu protein Com